MSTVEAVALAAPARRPWLRAVLWGAGLGPFFFLSYGAANWLASRHAFVPTVVFGWEHRIPFLPWTIIPYWSIDLFYGLSLFVCTSRDELDTHGKRLLTAQIVAVMCFVLFPLRFGFARPVVDGFSGELFAALSSFDRPFNQAPSLHIALVVILWSLYARHVPRPAAWAVHGWGALVGVSVLTTYQHHFVDVPTGALLGFFCLWLWPDGGGSAVAAATLAADPKRRRLARRYALGAAACTALAVILRGPGWFLLWPAVSLALVAVCYAWIGAGGFQKARGGRNSLGAVALLLPYMLGAWLNSRLWTRRQPLPAAVADGVWLGRIPVLGHTGDFAAVIDLCAELPGGSRRALWQSVPLLDLVPPDPARLAEIAGLVEQARAAGKVLVCCALGYGRSAAAVAAWLVLSRRAATVETAIATLRRLRPRIAIDMATRRAIAQAAGRKA